MSDILRYVTLDAGGRPSTVLTLDDQSTIFLERGSFTVTPPVRQPVTSTADRRYGGSWQVGQIDDNATMSWVAQIVGPSQDACIQHVEQLITQGEASPVGSLIEWRPDGSSVSTYAEVRGTMSWEPEYDWAPFAGAGVMSVKVSLPVEPLVRGLPMDVLDTFLFDTRSDYIYDSGAEGNEQPSEEGLEAVANVNTENRAIHTARGYSLADNQQTLQATPGATITGWKGGVVLKRITQTTYLEAYVDDEGTHSRLRIDKVVAGVRTNLVTKNLEVRITAGKTYWVRGRVERNVLTAEYFSGAPAPLGAPSATVSYTLAAGAERETFGGEVEGEPGRVWIPKTVDAKIGEYMVEPFTYRNRTLPEVLTLAGKIPGDAPALADITVTHSGGAAAPISALLGWADPDESSLGAEPPFGLVLADVNVSNLSGWKSSALAGSLTGAVIADPEANAATDYTASWLCDPATMTADEFTTEIAVDVWADMFVSATVLAPVLNISARPQDGPSYGSARYTDEWGQQGKLLTAPSAGTNIKRLTRLGTLRMLVDPLRPRKWLIWLDGEVGAGSSGEWGIDYLLLVGTGGHCCSPSGKPNDSGYPQFIASTAETSKTIHSDLSARVAKPPAYGHPDHGLGRNPIELPAAQNLHLLAKLSSLVPDDPTESGLSEQTTHKATVHAAITPRWHLLRPGS